MTMMGDKPSMLPSMLMVMVTSVLAAAVPLTIRPVSSLVMPSLSLMPKSGETPVIVGALPPLPPPLYRACRHRHRHRPAILPSLASRNPTSNAI